MQTTPDTTQTPSPPGIFPSPAAEAAALEHELRDHLHLLSKLKASLRFKAGLHPASDFGGRLDAIVVDSLQPLIGGLSSLVDELGMKDGSLLSAATLPRAAALMRDEALSAWEAGDSPTDVALLLGRSRDLFHDSGLTTPAGVTTALLGLLVAETQAPAAALSYFDLALAQLHSGPRFVLVLTKLAKALCLANLGSRSEALALLRDPSTPSLEAPEEILAARWLQARANAALGEANAVVELRCLVDRLLDNARYAQALLAALDLCCLYPQLAGDDMLDYLERRFRECLHGPEPHPTWLNAFRTLTSDLRAGSPFLPAVGAFPVLVPACLRFSIPSLHLLEEALP